MLGSEHRPLSEVTVPSPNGSRMKTAHVGRNTAVRGSGRPCGRTRESDAVRPWTTKSSEPWRPHSGNTREQAANRRATIWRTQQPSSEPLNPFGLAERAGDGDRG